MRRFRNKLIDFQKTCKLLPTTNFLSNLILTCETEDVHNLDSILILKKKFFIYVWGDTCKKLYCSMIAAAKSLQSCPTLWDPIDGSPPGSPIPGILQARTLEWVAISFSDASKRKVKVKSFSRVRLLATPWTAAHQAPPSMRFSRQEYWSGAPLITTKEKLVTKHKCK